MDQPFIQIRTACAFVSARIKITKAINSHTAHVKKKILAQRTVYPKCSDTRFNYADFFFQLSGYYFAPEGHEKQQLEGRHNGFTLPMYSLKPLFFVLNFFPCGFESYSQTLAKMTLNCTVNTVVWIINLYCGIFPRIFS